MCFPRGKFLLSHTHGDLQPHHLPCQVPILRLTPDACKIVSLVPERGPHPRLLVGTREQPMGNPSWAWVPSPCLSHSSCSAPRNLIFLLRLLHPREPCWGPGLGREESPILPMGGDLLTETLHPQSQPGAQGPGRKIVCTEWALGGSESVKPEGRGPFLQSLKEGAPSNKIQAE